MSTQDIEVRKIELEEKKASDEKFTRLITLASVVITALLSLGTLGYNYYQTNVTRQSEIETRQSEIEMQIQKNRLDFVVATAGILFETGDLTETYVKSVAMKNLFENTGLLPRKFSLNFPEGYYDRIYLRKKKRDLMDMLIAHPAQREEIITQWKSLFPEDKDWLDNLMLSVSK